MTEYQNEIDFLIACSRKSSAAELAVEVEPILAKPVAWDFVLRVSRRNAVLQLVATNLLKLESESIPEDVRSEIASRLRQYTDRSMFLTSRAVSILKRFESAGIPILPFKGPFLSIQAYGDLSLRNFCDLDVLVQPKHLDEAIRLLTEGGYEPVNSVSWLRKSNWYISRQKDVHFLDATRKTKVELHWKLSGSHFGLPEAMNRLWERLGSIQVAGMDVPSLSFNDLLIYLCLHGSRHSWERFSWICDVYYLLESTDDIDWTSILAESRNLGCENVVALGLKLVDEFFGYPVPEVFSEALANPVYDEMAHEIEARIFAPEKVHVQLGERYTYHLKLKERRLDRWKLHVHYLMWYLRLIVKPSQIDRDVLHLPRLLYPAYFITRPIRLLHDHFFKNSRWDEPLSPSSSKNPSGGDVAL